MLSNNLSLKLLPNLSSDQSLNVDINENFLTIDSIIYPVLVTTIPQNFLTESPLVGDAYFVGQDASGDFAQYSNSIATFTSSGWRFVKLKDGVIVYAKDTSKFMYYLNGSFNDFVTYSSQYYVGDYKYSARQTDHDRWLVCDGRAVLRSAFSSLFSVIGTSFGSGNGSTTFNLPDARGRVSGGVGFGNGLTNRFLGNYVGAEVHALSVNEIPSHNHKLRASFGSTSSRLSNVENTGIAGWNNGDAGYTNGGRVQLMENTGGNGAHNNMQPTIFAGYMFIYY